MASSSSSSPRSRRYDVFPSFSGEDVRKSFLSHLLKELHRRLINTFIDNGIERSRPIGPELFSAIRESRISIVVFSKNYASSTWCLNELVEIYKCYKELGQMVIPVFYDVDPSHVRKQTGDIGKVFEETCKGKTEDEKQWWIQALREVANIAGEDSRNWCDEANMIEKIADDVSNKLITPSDDFGDFVGIEAHLERLDSLLCLASGGVRMVGILGPSGIGKSTIARALFSRLSSQFHHRAFGTYKRTNRDDYGMKLCWEEQFLGELLCQKDIRICHLGVVEQRLKHKKVLIVLDDVDDLELLKTLVGKVGWFGFGSRIIVITKDRQLLKSHKIDLIYEVEFPSEGLALKMFCRSAFGENSPPHGFIELAVEVASLAGNLPLALNVLGSSLKGKDEEEWMEMLPRLRNGLDGKIEKTLRVSYDELDGKIQEVFLYIACLFNGEKVDNIKNFLGNSVNIDLRILADKSLISIIPSLKTVEMHGLLEKLGREIVRADSIYNPGKRRFLVDAEDIYDALTDNTGTETVLGIYLNTLEISRPLFIDEKSFEGMRNLLFLKIYKNMMRKATGKGRVFLPGGLVYLPRKLRLLYWENYPSKSLPCNFRGEYLVELSMEDSELEKLWEGSQQLQSLKKMNLRGSKDLKEIPDLSNAINLEELHLQDTSLVTLPSSIRNLKKLRELWMGGCKKLEVLPTNVNLESLDYLDLRECSQLRSFPRMSTNISRLRLDGGTAIEEEVCFWIENLTGLTMLFWTYCPLRCMPPNFHPEYLVDLDMRDSKLEKLWEGVKSLGNLKEMNLSGCENLKEIPDLSTATNLRRLHLKDCKSLVMLTSSIQNLNQLYRLDMNGCTRLEVLPTNVNLISLKDFTLNGCSRLRNFPQISTSITGLYLDDTAIEEVPSWIENIFGLARFSMRRCKMLKNISPNIFKLKRLEEVDFSDCGKVTTFRDASVVTMVVPSNGDQLHVPEESSFPLTDLYGENCESLQDISHSSYNPRSLLKFYNCFNLEQDAQGLILPSHFYNAILPGGEVPMYFTHRSCGNSLCFPISQSSLSQGSLGFKACIVLEPLTDNKNCSSVIWVSWHFGGINGKEQVYVESCEVDHLVMLHFTISSYYFNDPQPEVDYSNIEFEFDTGTCSSIYGSRRYGYGPQAFRCSVQRIKGCGIRFLNASPSSDGIGRCFETEYNHQYGESDVESGRSSETQHNEQCVESGRSKKLIRVSLCRRSVELCGLDKRRKRRN